MVSKLLTENVTIIKNVKYNETISLGIKLLIGVNLYVVCVYMPTQGNIKCLCTDRFNLTKKAICIFSQKGKFCFCMISMPGWVKAKM